MDYELRYISNRPGRGIQMSKTLKKLPPLPGIGDGWEQAGWMFVVDGRYWTESLDNVTIVLVSETSETPRDQRSIVADLAEAGWIEVASAQG